MLSSRHRPFSEINVVKILGTVIVFFLWRRQNKENSCKIIGRKCTRRLSSSSLSSALSLLGYSHRSPFSSSSSSSSSSSKLSCLSLLTVEVSASLQLQNLICAGRNLISVGEQGWRSGESTRLPPMWPGFHSRTRRNMWVEFVVGSLLALRVFLQVLQFSSLHRNQNCQIPIWSGISMATALSVARLLSATLVNKVDLFYFISSYLCDADNALCHVSLCPRSTFSSSWETQRLIVGSMRSKTSGEIGSNERL